MENKANQPPEAGDPALAAAATERDPTLEELAALENEVDNWLRPPAKAEPVAVAMATAAPAPAVRPDAPRPGVNPPPLPRARRPTPWWALGLGAAAAAAIGFALIGNQPSSDWAQDTAPTQARAVPAAPAAIPPDAPESKPVDMVFLKDAPADGATAGAAIQPAEQETVEPDQAADSDDEVPPAAVAVPVKAERAAAAPPARAEERTAAAPSARAERVAVARKPAVRSMTPDAMAEHLQGRAAGRRGSDRERLDKAIIQCNSDSRDPGACNLRACDVLGPSHPACRE